MSDAADRWLAGSTYEDFMGRWSRLLATRFVDWLPAHPGAHWLDVGCGTGALSAAICAAAQPASVVGCDPSTPFVEYARQHSPDERITFVAGGTGALPTRDGGFDRVVSALALNFFPDPGGAIDEMRRSTGAGGLVAACVWDYAGGMEFLRHFWDAAASVDSTARDLDEGSRFPICRADALETLFRAGGLDEVASRALEVPTRFASFEDFWRPLLGGTGPAPSYVAALDDDRRTALAERLSNALPRQPDGAIPLVARAWAVRGAVG